MVIKMSNNNDSLYTANPIYSLFLICNFIVAKYTKISTISPFGYIVLILYLSFILYFIMPQRVTFVRLQVIHHSI